MKIEMTSRECVLAALELGEPDRIPIDFGQATADDITIPAYDNLIEYLGLPVRPMKIKDKLSQTAEVDEDVLKRFRVDLRQVHLGAPDGWRDQTTGDDSYR